MPLSSASTHLSVFLSFQPIYPTHLFNPAIHPTQSIHPSSSSIQPFLTSPFNPSNHPIYLSHPFKLSTCPAHSYNQPCLSIYLSHLYNQTTYSSFPSIQPAHPPIQPYIYTQFIVVKSKLKHKYTNLKCIQISYFKCPCWSILTDMASVG